MFDFTRHQLIAAAVLVVAALLGTGLLVARSGVFGPATGDEISFIEPGGKREAVTSDTAVEEPSPEPLMLCIHVAGKVRQAGVYELQPGSRVKDAIEAAGGTMPDADMETINLADKLEDGQQVYIAAKGEIPPPAKSTVTGGSRPSSTTSGSASSDTAKSSGPEKLRTPGEGTVNINTAGSGELQRLPGVGPATAQNILDYRLQHGRFQSIEELDEVKGIGPAKLAQIRPFVKL